MKKRLIPMVWDDKKEWNSACPSYLSFPKDWKLESFKFKGTDAEAMEAGAKIYQENHNRDRANQEWSWLDNLCAKVYVNYCKLFKYF